MSRAKKLSKELEQVVEQKVAEAVSPSTIPGNQQTVAPVTKAVMEEIAPVVDHLTNQEPWWQSRVAIAALLIVFSRVVAMFGYQLPEELHGPITDIIIYVLPGVAVALLAWARYFARKPLFTTGKPLFSSVFSRWRDR